MPYTVSLPVVEMLFFAPERVIRFSPWDSALTYMPQTVPPALFVTKSVLAFKLNSEKP